MMVMMFLLFMKHIFFCPRYDNKLELPQLPEMVFPENVLRVVHESGAGIEFNALDALALVNAHADPVKVAASAEWQNARFVSSFILFICPEFFISEWKKYLSTQVNEINS